MLVTAALAGQDWNAADSARRKLGSKLRNHLGNGAVSRVGGRVGNDADNNADNNAESNDFALLADDKVMVIPIPIDIWVISIARRQSDDNQAPISTTAWFTTLPPRAPKILAVTM